MLLTITWMTREISDKYGLHVDVSQTMCLPCTGCDITPYRDIYIFFLVCSTFSFVCPKTYISFVTYYKCYFFAALHSSNLQTAPSARTSIHIRQILTTRSSTEPCTRSSASFFISSFAPSWKFSLEPLFFDVYCDTAACVIPSILEISFWDKPLLISSSASAARMHGNTSHTIISQGNFILPNLFV